MLLIPVALIIYNRAALTEKVFAAIRRVKPAILYIIADGPLNGEDKILTDAARAVTESIDWTCNDIRLYSDTHLGCRQRVLSGLNEVFAREERAIILEDDCLPQPDFFEYCTTLLHHYETDERVGALQGSSLPGFAGEDGQNSCVFSRLGILRGWATWRRVWQHVDAEMPGWSRESFLPLLIDAFPGKESLVAGLAEMFDKAKHGCNDWAPAFLFALLQRQQFHIHPADNLITHLGSGRLATHSHLMQSDTGLPAGPGWSHHHRALVQHDAAADQVIFNTLYHPAQRPGHSSESVLGNIWEHVKAIGDRLVGSG